MAEAGADIVVCHLGLTTGGAIGAETALTLADCVRADRRLGGGGAGGQPRRHRALPRRPDRHARRRRAASCSRCPVCHGFYGASSMERLPTEIALTETTRRFTQITAAQGDRP